MSARRLNGRGRAAGLPMLFWVVASTGCVVGDRQGEAWEMVERLVTPGVSRELASHRGGRISDLHYDLFFSIPDPTRPGPATPDASRRGPADATKARPPILGTVRMELSLPDGDEPLVLDFLAAEEAIRAVRVNGRDSPWSLRQGHLVVPPRRLRSGRNELEVAFVAGNAPFNRSDDFLYTLFVPDRAHQALPGFDQPDLKARFRLTLEVPDGWEAVANGALASEGSLQGRESGAGRRRLAFEETEPIPTYLFAFAAGRFQVEEAEREGRAMRLFHRETDADKVERNREAIFDLHAHALAWMEEYTGIPYPFAKFDFVAVPAFQYNGMEHPGAIFYRAEGLFLDPSATRTEELARASVIAHETAHMWFGNLVTMPWFDDVWMKEVFANFMAAKIVEPSYPEVDHDVRFLLAHQPAAYAVDRTPGANPIRQQLENLTEAGTLYGPIIYRKAPVVMRQLELLVGEERLREGLRRYLSEHAFGNASWPDLIAILDELTARDLAAWSRVWVEEPGRPWVGLELEETDGRIRTLRAVQHDPAGRGRLWPQAIGVLLEGAGGSRILPVVLEAPSAEIPEARGLAVPRVAVPDATGVGYAFFLLDSRTRERLLGGSGGLRRLRPAAARAAAWLALWDETLEGRVSPTRLAEAALDLAVPAEDELLVERALADLATVWWRLLSSGERAERTRRLEETLWARMHEAETASLKAAYLEKFRTVAITEQGTRRMGELWSGERQVPGLELSERDLTRLALEVAVRVPARGEEVLERQAGRIDNPDRRARFDFVRPAVDADPAVREAWFAALAEPEARRREPWVLEGLSLLHHPLRAEESLPLIRPGLELLPEIQRTGDIFFPDRWLEATLGGHASVEAAEIVATFLDERPELPARLREKVLQAADLLFRATGTSVLFQPSGPD